MKIKGKIFVYGDDVNTDVLFAGKYTYTVTDRKEMAKYALEDLDPEFVKTVAPGDVIVAGNNFGCGSSREQAVICLVENGVGAIIANSFSRIFFRNAINEGLAVLTIPGLHTKVQKGDPIEVDFINGKVVVPAGEFSFPPLPPEVRGIVEAGGLLPFTRKRLGLE